MVIGSIFRRRPLQILLFVLLLAPEMALFAGGGQERDPLAEARAAYEARDYNQAILLTAEVMKEHPERFDEAQSLINAIRAAKEKYNRSFAELIDLYQQALGEQDEEGLSESYTIIKELEELDPFPNEETEQGLVRAREATGTVFNRIRYSNIMDEALSSLRSGDYVAAVETYVEGFGLSLDIFRDKGYGEEPEAEAERLRARAEENVAGFIELADRIDAVDDGVDGIGAESGSDDIRPVLDELLPRYRELSDLRRDVQTTRRGLEVLRLLILREYADPGEDEIFHLAYLILIHRGRSAVEEELGVDEGILGVVDTRWTSGTGDLVARLAGIIGEEFDRAELLSSEEEYAAAAEVYDELSRLAGQLREVSSLWRYQLAPPPEEGEEEPDWSALAAADDAPDYIDYYRSAETFSDVAESVAAGSTEIVAVGEELRQRAVLLDGEETPGRDAIETVRAELGEIVLRLDQLDQRTEELAADLPTDPRFAETARLRLAALDRQIDGVRGFYRDTVESFLLESARLAAAPLGEELETLLLLREEADQALSGETVTFQGADFVARYPGRALDLSREIADRGELLAAANRSLLDELAAEPDWLRERTNVAAAVTSAQTLDTRITELLDRNADGLEEADLLVREAVQRRQQGEARFDEARSRVANRRFSVANPNAVENLIGDARDLFLESIQLQYDPLLDRRTDTVPGNSDAYDVQTLLAELATAKRDFYLPQREAAIADARSLIRQQEFDQASRTLNRAEDLHAQLDAGENPEISRLKEFVDRAINTSSAWYISNTDPLYAEMTQLLNLARNDFLAAQRRVEQGSSAGVESLLRSAEEKLSAVQNTFPQNLEVGILSLRIELLRTTGAAARRATLSEKLNQAQTAFANEEYQRALSLAKALQAIEPDFPGLNNLIVEAEIATGQRVREPDPADVRAAEALYTEANTVWRNRIVDQYPAALETIQRAIARYTPFSPPGRYLELKGNLETRVVTSAAPILSAADQLQYQSALEAYQQGNFIQAKLIVDQLVQKGDNARVPKLQDLQRRIESRL